MRFFMLSDLHLGSGLIVDKAKNQLVSLCAQIRTDTSPSETILFIVLGDIINASNVNAFSDARVCLDCIREELQDYLVRFEFVPGNHDLPKGDMNPFDRFVSEYCAAYPFEKTGAYSRIYDDVNFIFADSNLYRDHRMPGKLDLEAIRNEVKSKQNILFCHHGFTHDFGGGHDTVENGTDILRELKKMGIRFAFHGHTHRADARTSNDGITEIGCGSVFMNLSDMEGIQNQFSVGYIRDGGVVRVERFVVSKDGSSVFPCSTLYPEQRTFADPKTIDKLMYEPVASYINRKVLPHDTMIGDRFIRFFSREKETTLLDATKDHKRILFLSDAGQGKSVELEHLAFKLCDSPFFPYLCRLRNYTGSAIEDLLPVEYRRISPYYLAIMFDGYDELPTDDRIHFEKQLNSYVEKYPDAHLVISSRSNFCKAEKKSESRTFKGFMIFDLCELTEADIETYLDGQGINPQRFLTEARSVGIQSLLVNPFYLTQVGVLYVKSGSIPPKVELMDKLVENSFDFDDGKFAGNLEDNYYELMCLLEKVSFTMQLMQRSSIDDRKEYQRLFTKDNRDIIQYSGLFLKEGESWRFVHNNFREYLTAKYLSKLPEDQIKAYISSGDGIKPSWVNTLSYLTGIELSWDLLGWIAEFSPNALVKFEPDRVGSDVRFAVFERIFLEYESKLLWFHDDLCNEAQLAHFSQSDAALTFLLDRIENPVHTVSQYTAIDILRYYSSLFGRQEEVLTCLLNCCDKYPSVEGSTCRLAIYAIQQLGLNTADVTRGLMERFNTCDNDHIRLGLYEYLLATKEHNHYVRFFLNGIRFVSHEYDDGNDRVGNEEFRLAEGLQRLSTADSIAMAVLWYASETDVELYEAEKVFSALSENAISVFWQDTQKLYDTFLQCCVKALREYSYKSVRDCISFFERTGTFEAAVVDIAELCVEDIQHFYDILYDRPDAVRFVLAAYSEERFNNHEAFRSIVMHNVDDDTLYGECSEVIYNRTGEYLPIREPKIDYQAIRRKGNQDYFDALFSRDRADAMLSELIDTIGKPDIQIEDLLDRSNGIKWDSPLGHLQIAIYHGVYDRSLRVADFFEKIEFDRFCLIECKKMLKSKVDIVITQEQKGILYQIVTYWIDKNVLRDEVSVNAERTTWSKFVHALIYICQHFDFDLSEEALLDMTVFPDLCFGEVNGRKYRYLKSHASIDKLKARVIGNIKGGNLDSMLLREHLEFCAESRCDAVTKEALTICTCDSFDTWLRGSALDYLYKLYGPEYICKRVLPYAKGEFMLEIFTKCKDISTNDLCGAMEAEYKREPSYALMASLISLGSHVAVDAYVAEVTEKCSIPEHDTSPDSPTRTIAKLNDPVFLPQLAKLMDVVCKPEFVDHDFFGLRSSLRDALINCGKEDPDTVSSVVAEHRDNSRKEENHIRYCNYIIEEISLNARKKSDQPMDIETVRRIIAE